MSCRPSRNGSTPVVRVRPRCTRGEMTLIPPVPIIIGMEIGIQVMILNKLVMWANTRPTRGAFLTCMGMSGNGLQIGTRRPIPPTTRWSTRPDRPQALIESYGVAPGATMSQNCGRPGVAVTPPTAVSAALVFVLVSKTPTKHLPT